MHNFKQGKSQKGITLIELMIALTLGLVIMAGVISGMGALNVSTRTQINSNNLQVAGNMALDYITFQLRSTLSFPCDRFSVVNAINGISMDLPSLSTDSYTPIKKTSDLENMIKHLGVRIKTTDIRVDKKTLKTDNLTFFGTDNQFFDIDFTRIKDNNYYVATDCEEMKIMKGLAVKTSDMQIIAPLMASVISIHKNGDVGRNRNTLYVRSLLPSYDEKAKKYKNSRAERLMDNIEAMRVFFGVDEYQQDAFTGKYSKGSDGVLDSFKTAKEIEDDIEAKRDNYQIISAEIYVLVRADNPDYSSPNSYTVYLPRTDKGMSKINEDSEIVFTDSVPRKVFTRSVNFRNTSKAW